MLFQKKLELFPINSEGKDNLTFITKQIFMLKKI